MILGVDVNRLVGQRTGVGRAYEYLLQAWCRQELPFERIELFSPAPIPDLPHDDRLRLHVVPSRGPGIWWQTVHVGRRAASLDVLLAPYSLPVGYRGRCVVENWGILDGEHRPPAWNLRRRGRRWHFSHSARHADRVIAVSEVVRDDVVRWYGTPEEKVTIIPPGISDHFRPARPADDGDTVATVERLLGCRAPYFVFVGKLSARRHLPELLDAFSQLRPEHPDVRLLIVGPNPAHVPVGAIAARLGCDDRVVHVEHLDHDALAALYRGAIALVLPTTKEGWSLPVREALACGCAVVTVDGPWLVHDGARDAVLAVAQPTAVLLEQAMRRVAEDGELRSALRTKGLACAAAFPTQEQRAREVMKLLADTARS